MKIHMQKTAEIINIGDELLVGHMQKRPWKVQRAVTPDEIWGKHSKLLNPSGVEY